MFQFDKSNYRLLESGDNCMEVFRFDGLKLTSIKRFEFRDSDQNKTIMFDGGALIP